MATGGSKGITLIDKSETAFDVMGLKRTGDLTDITPGKKGESIITTEIPRYIWEGMDLDLIRGKREMKKQLIDQTSAAGKLMLQIDAHHKAIEDEVFKFTKGYAAMLYAQGMFSSKASAKHAMTLGLYMLNDIQGTLDDVFEGVLSSASASRKQIDENNTLTKLQDAEYEGHGTRKPKPKRVARND